MRKDATDPRQAAGHAVNRILDKGCYSNEEVASWLRRENWSSEDRRLFIRVVYGTLDHLYAIDQAIANAASRAVGSIDPNVRSLLRISSYQLLYTDRIPAYAVINEAVQGAKKNNRKAAGFVNAVLRNISSNSSEIRRIRSGGSQLSIESKVIHYSHPKWLIEKLTEQFGTENTRKILETHQKPPDLTIRINTLKGDPRSIAQMIEKSGVCLQPIGWMPESYHVIHTNGLITEIDAYRKGYFFVQSVSSMLAVHWLDPQPGEIVIDVAAAPGGKTTHIAQRMRGEGLIIARDTSAERLKQVDKHAERLGCKAISTEEHNGTREDPEWAGKADRVLVDAPCSSLGMIRKKPELKYMKKPDEIPSLSALQQSILRQSASLVKPGGVLFYATCSYLSEENQQVIQRFLRDHNDFQMSHEKVDVWDQIVQSPGQSTGAVQLGPHIHSDFDGFFMAKMRKCNSRGEKD